MCAELIITSSSISPYMARWKLNPGDGSAAKQNKTKQFPNLIRKKILKKIIIIKIVYLHERKALAVYSIPSR
jgi:hypothetical protein